MGRHSLLLSAILAFILASPVAAWPPVDFRVPESELERHLEEFEITGEAANNVRAAWGRLEFNARVVRENGDLFRTWMTPRNVFSLRLLEIPEYQRYRRVMLTWSSDFEKDANTNLVQLSQDYFDAIAAAAVNDIRAEHLRARHLIGLLHDSWVNHLVGGDDIDLYAILKLVDGVTDIDDSVEVDTLREPIALAIQQYEAELAPLLIRRMHLVDEYYTRLRVLRFSEDSFPTGEQQWIEETLESRLRPLRLARQIRSLNERYAARLTSLLPAEQADIFRQLVMRAMNPRIWADRDLEYDAWIKTALNSPMIDNKIKEAIRSLRIRLNRERSDLVSELVRLQEPLGSISLNEPYYRAQVESDLLEKQTGEGRHVQAPPERQVFNDALARLDEFDIEATTRIKMTLGTEAASVIMAQFGAAAHDAEELEQIESRKRIDESESLPRWFLPMVSAAEFNDFVSAISTVENAIFRQRYRDFVSEMATARSSHENAVKQGMLPDVFRRNAKWNRTRTQVERSFVNDIRILLPPEEVDLWDQLVREWRRHRSFPAVGMQLSQQSHHLIDPLDVIELAGMTSELTAVATHAVNAWELAVDDALRKFEDQWDHQAAEYFHDRQRAQNAEERERARERARRVLYPIRERVLDAQVQGIDFVRAALSDEDLQRFNRALNESIYPWLFADSAIDLIVEGLQRDGRYDGPDSALGEIVHQYNLQRLGFQSEMLPLLWRIDFIDSSEKPELYEQYLMRIWRLIVRQFSVEQRTGQRISLLYPPERRDDLALDTRLLLDVISDSPR